VARDSSPLLPQVSFTILLALSLKPRHGYEIMQQVDADSDGRIKLAPGSLYGAIKQLREDGLIEEFEQSDAPRRRYYRLTSLGAEALSTELDYYQTSIDLARQRQVLETGYGFAL
jgi:DNA-binding PadR family transcriptional regulator